MDMVGRRALVAATFLFAFLAADPAFATPPV
jgi:hypothetical protein